MGAWTCTREDVKGALDSAETARSNTQVDRAVESASRSVEGLLRRRFRPTLATRTFPWPPTSRSRHLWLDADEVISVTTLSSGGVAIPALDYFLEPANSGPPYSRIEVDAASSSAFTSSTSRQRAIEVTGLFGYTNEEEAVGSLTAQLAAAASSTAAVAWTTPHIGVGDVLRVDAERVVVTGRTMTDSGQNLLSPLTTSTSNVSVPVTTGSAFAVDEVLLVDSERLLVVDVAGNTLTVKRAWDGTVLAAHTGSDIFTLTGVTLARGLLGTAAAVHLNAATVYRHVVPGLVRELTIALAMSTIQQEQSAYARTVGSGDNEREAAGRGLADIRREALSRYGRRARTRAV